MLYLSREETIENHRRMWNWIAEETLRQKKCLRKDDYFNSVGIAQGFRPVLLCYCCDYSKMNCCYCPLMWGDGSSYKCTKADSYFDKWANSLERNDYKEASKWAKEIADLPERKGF